MSTITELAVERVDVNDVIENDWNPNVQSETVARAERESIERYGFIDPILVRPHPTIDGKLQIVDGAHRWRTVKELGHTTIDVIVRNLSDDDAKKLTVVLNETRGDPDQIMLAELLSDLSALDDFKVALPYTDRELEKLLALTAEPTDASDPDPPASPPVEIDLSLTYSADQHDLVIGWLKILAKHTRKRGHAAVVFEVLRAAALEANQKAA